MTAAGSSTPWLDPANRFPLARFASELRSPSAGSGGRTPTGESAAVVSFDLDQEGSVGRTVRGSVPTLTQTDKGGALRLVLCPLGLPFQGFGKHCGTIDPTRSHKRLSRLTELERTDRNGFGRIWIG